MLHVHTVGLDILVVIKAKEKLDVFGAEVVSGD